MAVSARPQVDVLIKPCVLRFSVYDGSPVYYFTRDSDTALDGLERALGIDPAAGSMTETNLGFLPISSTVLIRGETNIVIDPGNFHVGQYGMLKTVLAERGLVPEDIDTVICTHSHLDHMGSSFVFRGSRMIVGPGELEWARTGRWPEIFSALSTDIMSSVDEWGGGGAPALVCPGVWVLHTPGHTPGSLSVLVETEQDRVAIVGDVIMTAGEYVTRRFSHWYRADQVDDLNESLDRIGEWQPSLVICGHDDPFAPREAAR